MWCRLCGVSWENSVFGNRQNQNKSQKKKKGESSANTDHSHIKGKASHKIVSDGKVLSIDLNASHGKRPVADADHSSTEFVV